VGGSGISFALRFVTRNSPDSPVELKWSSKTSKKFNHELKDALDAERQILKVLPKIVRAVKSDKLKRSFATGVSV
jgi:hypothetical protein